MIPRIRKIPELFWQQFMSMEPANTARMEFNIREGGKSIHSELLMQNEKLFYAIDTAGQFDIEFSIRAISSSSVNRGAWIVSPPKRIKNLRGSIDPSVLSHDGIKLPVTIEFLLDNKYSWFNSKKVNLSINKESEPVPVISDVVRNDSRLDYTHSWESKSSEVQDIRAKIDLQWLNHVIGEALLRCPPSAPAVREKLEEVKNLLKQQVPEAKSRAII